MWNHEWYIRVPGYNLRHRWDHVTLQAKTPIIILVIPHTWSLWEWIISGFGQQFLPYIAHIFADRTLCVHMGGRRCRFRQVGLILNISQQVQLVESRHDHEALLPWRGWILHQKAARASEAEGQHHIGLLHSWIYPDAWFCSTAVWGFCALGRTGTTCAGDGCNGHSFQFERSHAGCQRYSGEFGRLRRYMHKKPSLNKS